jgi:hypothetical protein
VIGKHAPLGKPGAATRLRLANEGAARTNIEQALREISKLDLD